MNILSHIQRLDVKILYFKVREENLSGFTKIGLLYTTDLFFIVTIQLE